VAEDVKKGHFVVIAKDEDEAKRFIVPLSCLTNPIFVSLLEEAAEKYGFNGDGALTVPCRPNDISAAMEMEAISLMKSCLNATKDDLVMNISS